MLICLNPPYSNWNTEALGGKVTGHPKVMGSPSVLQNLASGPSNIPSDDASSTHHAVV